MSDEKKKFLEKRRGPDLLIKWVRWTVLAGWLLIITIVCVIKEAQPPQEGFLDRLFHNHLRKTWDTNLLNWVFLLLIGLYILCIVAFIFNLRRSKRKSDRVSISLILLGLGSFAGIIIYVLKV